jgi:hypothetical protein
MVKGNLRGKFGGSNRLYVFLSSAELSGMIHELMGRLEMRVDQLGCFML